jgi:hypothetical protein
VTLELDTAELELLVTGKRARTLNQNQKFQTHCNQLETSNTAVKT